MTTDQDLTSEQMLSALQFYVDAGVEDILNETPIDRTQKDKTTENVSPALSSNTAKQPHKDIHQAPETKTAPPAFEEARELAKSCGSLQDLKDAIANFDGLGIKKTATNMVFSDGHANAKIMLIGEAPGADEDRLGKPFVGRSGQLLDKILSTIGLSRHEENPQKAIYISNILNWRPPGNRTPTESEIELSLPFIEKHIALINPDFIILCGGISSKALLNKKEGISRLRGKDQNYIPMTKEISENPQPISCLATYHPAYLLRNPIQKRLVWQDMLFIKNKLQL